jgi:endonuclease YncB( thermonuclease family)
VGRFFQFLLACCTVFPLSEAKAEQTSSRPSIGICSGGDRAARRVTCLVDGDTGWEAGRKWRLKGVDTPEHASHAGCRQETEFAAAATYRMLELLAGGSYSITWLGERTSDRELVYIRLNDGRDVGGILVAEKHAVTWPHADGIWCDAG